VSKQIDEKKMCKKSGARVAQSDFEPFSLKHTSLIMSIKQLICNRKLRLAAAFMQMSLEKSVMASDMSLISHTSGPGSRGESRELE
jgi:hypothetical protein